MTQRQSFIDEGQGGAQPNISQQIVRSHPILIAPRAEQRRIVAKLEKLLGKVDACQKRLEKVPLLLKRFRQSVLAAACSGTLTEDWRESSGTDAGSPNLSQDGSPEMCGGWRLTTLREIVQSLDQGWSPKCEIEPSPAPHVWAVIKTTAVQALEFIESENKRLPQALTPRETLELRPGDLLITRAGPRARAGICCLVHSVRPRLMICDKVYRFRINERRALPSFVVLALNTPAMAEYIDTLKTGISDSGVNLTQEKFLDLRIPLPPLEEQQEVVDRVDALFSLAVEIESRFRNAKAHVDKLTQSILAKAFRGELVAQDPNDEPASVLLERVRKERQSTVATPHRPKVKSASV